MEKYKFVVLVVASLTIFRSGVNGDLEGFVSQHDFLELKQMFMELQSRYENLEKTNLEIKTENIQMKEKYEFLMKNNVDIKTELLQTNLRLTELKELVTPTKTMTYGTGQQKHKENKSPNNMKFINAFNHDNKTNKNEDSLQIHVDKQRRILPPITKDNAQSRIAFFVRYVFNRQDLGYHQTIIFKDVYTNEGNCYHKSTGVFACNVSGIYVFFWNILVAPGQMLQTALTKDGQAIAISRSTGFSDYTPGSNMAIIHVNAGESVFVRTFNHPSSGDVIAAYENTFSGFLLYQDL